MLGSFGEHGLGEFITRLGYLVSRSGILAAAFFSEEH